LTAPPVSLKIPQGSHNTRELMKPIDTVVDRESEEDATKVKVHFHERDTAKQSGRSAEIVVYVDRRSLQLPEISTVAVRSAEEFLRRILDQACGNREND
jgi:hypothetical protein